jgi:hypothetical protein
LATDVVARSLFALWSVVIAAITSDVGREERRRSVVITSERMKRNAAHAFVRCPALYIRPHETSSDRDRHHVGVVPLQSAGR